MVDEEVKEQASERKQYYFTDGTQNPHYNDAIKLTYPLFGIFFNPTKNLIINTAGKWSALHFVLMPGGSDIEEMIKYYQDENKYLYLKKHNKTDD